MHRGGVDPTGSVPTPTPSTSDANDLYLAGCPIAISPERLLLQQGFFAGLWQGPRFIFKVSSLGAFEGFLMDSLDIPSKWSTLCVNSVCDKDPFYLLFIILPRDMKYTRRLDVAFNFSTKPIHRGGKKIQFHYYSCVRILRAVY